MELEYRKQQNCRGFGKRAEELLNGMSSGAMSIDFAARLIWA